MSVSRIMTGFITGAAIGGVLGVLFAPDKGTETRRKISEKSNDMANSLKDNFKEFVDGVKDKFGKSTTEDVEENAIGKNKKFKGQASTGF
jgi:gas vesicle protein